MPDRALLEVENLSVGFARQGDARGTRDPRFPCNLGMAVEEVGFSLERGKVLCLVGESGCGKSVTALSLPRLLPSPPAVFAGGRVLFDGQDLAALSDEELRQVRGNKTGMVFQDPMTSLNPVLRVGDQMSEALRLHRGFSAAAAKDAAVAMLERVGIGEAAARARDFPHQMSGGMRQRVMIGMALACGPKLIIADEPTTALDVTVQKQILDLMRSLVDDSKSALLLITHDLGIVARIADDVAVMYAGRIVEQGPAQSLLAGPLHPYTIGLLRSRPGIAERKARLDAIPGAVPGLWEKPAGCAFHPRCSSALPCCRAEVPPLLSASSGRCRCWLVCQ